ncbi:MAG: hypothetical protein QM676_01080 [Novosphingobium sp.]
MGRIRETSPIAASTVIQLGDVRTAMTHLKCALAVLDRTEVYIAASYAEMALGLCGEWVEQNGAKRRE